MTESTPRGFRTLSYAALAAAYLQIVFGGIVRITESGMGCGDHWPKCAGYWIPPLDQPQLVIEVTHRYLALGVSLLVLALAVAAMRWSYAKTFRGSTLAAVALVVVAALLGAVTVKLELPPLVVVAHLIVAMTLLAVLTWIALRASGATETLPASPRTVAASRAAAGMSAIIVVLGALTANVVGSAGSCVGFPHCREITTGGGALWIQIAHRVVAFALAFHAFALWRGMRRRDDPPLARGLALWLVAIVAAQILLAAAMVEMRFPTVVRSLHQAFGTLTWVAAFSIAAVTASSRRRDA